MTTITAPALPSDTLSRLRWGISDALVITRRDLTHMIRQPERLLAGLAFPIVQVLLFAYVFGSAIQAPGGGNYREFLMPGLFTQSMVFGVMATTVVIAGDKSKGVIDRFRSMPMSRSATLFGQTTADILTGTLYLVVMMLCGLAVGWRAHLGTAHLLAGVGLLVLLRYALSWVGMYLGLVVRSPEAADSFVPLVFPVTMIANTFVPTQGMPVWLRVMADWNPVSAVVGATRELFGNPGAIPTGDAPFPLQHPIAIALAWSIGLLVVFIPLAVHRWRAIAE